eukprot:10796230-Karenia_brevis.AAC.1
MSASVQNAGATMVATVSHMLEQRVAPIQRKVESHDQKIQHLTWLLEKQTARIEALEKQVVLDSQSGGKGDGDTTWDAPPNPSVLRMSCPEITTYDEMLKTAQ